MKLTVVILTFNEIIHIERVIHNVKNFADHIVVLDSYSTDGTPEKAKELGADVLFRKFDHYKNQRDYAIHYCADKTEWMLFLDADEYLTDELKIEIQQAIQQPAIAGYYLPRRFIFMNRWIKWGGYYPTYLLRLFRPQQASLHGIINEHVTVSGKKAFLTKDFVDHNLKGISNWVDKHNRYASFEAQALWDFKQSDQYIDLSQHQHQQKRKLWLKNKIWNKLPTVVVRPFVYFTYRYFFRLGFLDGKEGFIYHFLQGFWFWLLIDVKYTEFKKTESTSCAE